MHAIIRQGNGKFYVSAVFGYYKDITAEDDYKRYIEEIHKPYWIVWDEEQKRLIRWSTMVPDKKYIIPQILIIDSDQNNWVMDEQGVGCVDFLSRELLDSFLDEEQQPTDVLEKCRTAYQSFVYNETPEIKTKKTQKIFTKQQDTYMMHILSKKKYKKMVHCIFYLTECGDVKQKYGSVVIWIMIPQAEILNTTILVGMVQL